MCVVCECRFSISFTYVIESIESKVIPACFINDYSLIAQLHFLVYERAELSSISLECTKVKLSILNNFGKMILPQTICMNRQRTAIKSNLKFSIRQNRDLGIIQSETRTDSQALPSLYISTSVKPLVKSCCCNN